MCFNNKKISVRTEGCQRLSELEFFFFSQSLGRFCIDVLSVTFLWRPITEVHKVVFIFLALDVFLMRPPSKQQALCFPVVFLSAALKHLLLIHVGNDV